MTFLADLHVHSKFSRATSRDLDLEHLAWWAARKGIAVVGTGDCVHPGWVAEIRDKLVPAGDGLFRLRPEIETPLWETLPSTCRTPARFLLSTEISTIYKKGDKTRKVHHLILLPSIEAADGLGAALARIGNIASDGRPILGLDSRDLLEITLAAGGELIPAHIWTPWFAAMGSKSGFDSIADCYGDLSEHIHAVETGLSSDPLMNRRVSSLDRYRLVSNSDAHSPGKLGREATRFSGGISYPAIIEALRTGEGHAGTIEFFPEEGKYHLDGHRACGVVFEPRETIAAGGRCPVCGAPVTVGVAHRVELLADRSEEEAARLIGPVSSLVPMPEILGEIVGAGAAAKSVTEAFDRALAKLGPELAVLESVPIEELTRFHPLLGEAIVRLRAGRVVRRAGYDGEYGVIRLFEEGELDRLSGTDTLFDTPIVRRTRAARKTTIESAPETTVEAPRTINDLDPEQTAAVEATEGPLMIVAGPGSGKTRTLVRRIVHLIRERGVAPAAILAVTFTRKATEELRNRLSVLLEEGAAAAVVHSFHSLGLSVLRKHGERIGLSPDLRVADEVERRSALVAATGMSETRAARLLRTISTLKRTGEPGNGEERETRALLDRRGREEGWVDFDDLVGLTVELLERDPEVAAWWRGRFAHIMIDEFQDLDATQYRLTRLLAGEGRGLCVIGDPDQAIYGFRGADAAGFERLAADFRGARTLRLSRNYRSSGTIVEASSALMGRRAGGVVRPAGEPITLHVAANEADEAEFVAATIEALLGGHDMLAAGRSGREERRSLSFADCAVLYRTDARSSALRTAFDRAGIPYGKSSPAPIADDPGVRVILARLAEDPEGALSERIARAAELARREGEVDAATLALARGRLIGLAEFGDEARLRDEAALATEADFRDARADRVTLSTLHAAKGLEFPVVFVVGVETGLIPLSWDGEEEATDEERRLFYVAMTRAGDRLYLTRAAERTFRGNVGPAFPSPFLADIPRRLTVVSGAAPKRKKARQLSLF